MTFDSNNQYAPDDAKQFQMEDKGENNKPKGSALRSLPEYRTKRGKLKNQNPEKRNFPIQIFTSSKSVLHVY